MQGLFDWARLHRITFSSELTRQIGDGFSARRDDEDAFDALIGLLGMIEVVDGHRLEYPADRDNDVALEGWILGQIAYAVP